MKLRDLIPNLDKPAVSGSLDTEISKGPDAHVFCASQRNWEDGLEKIKRFEKFPS